MVVLNCNGCQYEPGWMGFENWHQFDNKHGSLSMAVAPKNLEVFATQGEFLYKVHYLLILCFFVHILISRE